MWWVPEIAALSQRIAWLKGNTWTLLSLPASSLPNVRMYLVISSVSVVAPTWWCVSQVRFVSSLPRALRDSLWVKEVGRRAEGKGSFGAASEGLDGSRAPWQEVLNSQGAAWKHFVPEEGEQKVMITNFTISPEPSLEEADRWLLVIFSISSGTVKTESLFWDQRLKAGGRKWPAEFLFVCLFCFHMHSSVLFLKWRYYLHIIKFSHFQCRVGCILVLACNCVATNTSRYGTVLTLQSFPLLPFLPQAATNLLFWH